MLHLGWLIEQSGGKKSENQQRKPSNYFLYDCEQNDFSIEVTEDEGKLHDRYPKRKNK